MSDFRIMAEAGTNLACQKLNNPIACRSHLETLSGEPVGSVPDFPKPFRPLKKFLRNHPRLRELHALGYLGSAFARHLLKKTCGAPAFTENHNFEPNSPYAASKAASDHLVRAYQHTYGLPTLTTNCSNNYGPYHFPEKLIPLMILNALEGKPLPVYGDGRQIRDWLYVEDHARAIWLVLLKGRIGETYNIGGLNEKPNIEIVQSICALLGKKAPRADGKPYESQITYVTDRPGHDRRYAIDCTKINRELGWKPAESFATGIAKTVDWYLQNRAWAADITARKYSRERLGTKV